MICSRTFFSLLVALAVFAGAVSHATAGITVDGDLSDWGITIDSSGHLVYNPAYGYIGDAPVNSVVNKTGTATIGGVKIHFNLEDSDDDTVDFYRVGPQYGGQNYDAEALLVTVDTNTLYIAIASGQRPDNKAYRGNGADARFYGPGDILLMTDASDAVGPLYGIEVGGGPGAPNPMPESLDETSAGWTYALQPNGYTDPGASGARLPVDSTPVMAGSLWHTMLSNWGQGIVSGELTQLLGGDYVGLADYVLNFYQAKDINGNAQSLREHSIIELSIPYTDTMFNGSVDYVRWSPACSNDILRVLEVRLPPPVPEPGSLIVWVLLALSCGGCSWWRWRRRREFAP
jgi:hypothetical protein